MTSPEGAAELLERDKTSNGNLEPVIEPRLKPEELAGHRITSDYCLEEMVVLAPRGVIYDGEDEKHSRRLAFKFARTETLQDAEMSRQFREEPEIVARADIKGLTLITSGTYEGLPWYAMRYVCGTTLEEHLEIHNEINPLVGIPEVLDLVGKFRELHERGVRHRDIRPRNIMYENGELVPIDFGSGHIAGQQQYKIHEVNPTEGTDLEKIWIEITGNGAPERGIGNIIAQYANKFPYINRRLAELVERTRTNSPEEIRHRSFEELEADLISVLQEYQRAPTRRIFMLGTAATATIGLVGGLPYAIRTGRRLATDHDFRESLRRHETLSSVEDIAENRRIIGEGLVQQVAFLAEDSADIPANEPNVPYKTETPRRWDYKEAHFQFAADWIGLLLESGLDERAVMWSDRMELDPGNEVGGKLGRFAPLFSVSERTGNEQYANLAIQAADLVMSNLYDERSGILSTEAKTSERHEIASLYLHPLLIAASRVTEKPEYAAAAATNMRDLIRFNTVQGGHPELEGLVRESVGMRNGNPVPEPHLAYKDPITGESFHASYQLEMANALLDLATDREGNIVDSEFLEWGKTVGFFPLRHTDNGMLHYGIIYRSTPFDVRASTKASVFARRAASLFLDMRNVDDHDFCVAKANEIEGAVIREQVHPYSTNVGIVTGACTSDGAKRTVNISTIGPIRRLHSSLSIT